MEVRPSPPDARDGVICIDEASRQVIGFDRRLIQAPARVWQAITDPAEVRRWARGSWDFEPRVGGSMCLVLGEAADPDAVRDEGTVSAYEPPHHVEFTLPFYTASGSESGEHILRWSVEPSGSGTLLHFGDVFAPGQPVRNVIACGWHFMLDRLEEHLAGRDVALDWEDRAAEMERLYWRYRNAPRPRGWPGGG